MTRRDTIIVAVLINAGLLVVLFISSLKNEKSISANSYDKRSEQAQVVTRKETPIAKASSDQVDQILAQYSKKMAKEAGKEEKKVISKENAPKEMQGAEVAIIKEKVKQEQGAQGPEKAPLSTPQKAKEQSQDPRSGMVKIVVKKGDVLEKLAKAHGTSVGAIMQENQLTDSRLQIGQVIYIPPAAPVVSAIKALPQLEEQYYVVKNGDNLWKIALDNHLKVEDLLKLNELSEKQAKALRPGDRLRIK
jgi:peptidoglycan DL-endopeptidase LytF